MNPRTAAALSKGKSSERIDVKISKAKISTAINTFEFLGHKYTIADISKVSGLSVRTVSKYYKTI